MNQLRRLISLACMCFMLPLRVFAETSTPSVASAPLPPAAQEAMHKGTLAAQQQQWDLALNFFGQARTLAPGAPQPLFDLGLAEANIPGRSMRAICWFRAYLALAPDAPNAGAVRDQLDRLEINAGGSAYDILKILKQLAAQFPGGSGDADYAQSVIGSLQSQVNDTVSAGATAPEGNGVVLTPTQRTQAWIDYLQNVLAGPLFTDFQTTLVGAGAVTGDNGNKARTIFDQVRSQADLWLARLKEVSQQFPEQNAAKMARRAQVLAAHPELLSVAQKVSEATGIMLVLISPGTFLMGSPLGEPEWGHGQYPVTLTKFYWLGATDVTQAQYQAVMGNNPSFFVAAGGDAPVEKVSWDDAMEFCQKLTEHERAAGRLPEGYAYTLPTEAQWEYACRAGTTGERYGNLDDIAWYSEKSGSTHPVGQKLPNAWGLYDMIGNVEQWCSDRYINYPGGSVVDPTGPSSGTYRVHRGSCWSDTADFCQPTTRWWADPGDRYRFLGFRVALSSVR
jgi:formylglycine-generating enzyme required for sulfatase activity